MRPHARLLPVVLELGHQLVFLVNLLLLRREGGGGGDHEEGEKKVRMERLRGEARERERHAVQLLASSEPTFSSSTRWISPRNRLISCRLCGKGGHAWA